MTSTQATILEKHMTDQVFSITKIDAQEFELEVSDPNSFYTGISRIMSLGTRVERNHISRMLLDLNINEVYETEDNFTTVFS